MHCVSFCFLPLLPKSGRHYHCMLLLIQNFFFYILLQHLPKYGRVDTILVSRALVLSARFVYLYLEALRSLNLRARSSEMLLLLLHTGRDIGSESASWPLTRYQVARLVSSCYSIPLHFSAPQVATHSNPFKGNTNEVSCIRGGNGSYCCCNDGGGGDGGDDDSGARMREMAS